MTGRRRGYRGGQPAEQVPPPVAIPSGSFMDTHGNPALSGSWLRRRGAEPARHRCNPPVRIAGGAPMDDTALTLHPVDPDGHRGDLWRCVCGKLWRIGDACNLCDGAGHGNPPTGMCTVGLRWRPAGWIDRLANWRRRHRPVVGDVEDPAETERWERGKEAR